MGSVLFREQAMTKLIGPFETATKAREYVLPPVVSSFHRMEWNAQRYPILCVLVARQNDGQMAYCWEPWESLRNDTSCYILRNALELGDLR